MPPRHQSHYGRRAPSTPTNGRMAKTTSSAALAQDVRGGGRRGDTSKDTASTRPASNVYSCPGVKRCMEHVVSCTSSQDHATRTWGLWTTRMRTCTPNKRIGSARKHGERSTTVIHSRVSTPHARPQSCVAPGSKNSWAGDAGLSTRACQTFQWYAWRSAAWCAPNRSLVGSTRRT